MTKEEMKKLTHFLTKHHVYDSFRANYANSFGKERFFYPNLAFLGGAVISCAFPWRTTKQGEDFWRDIKNKAIEEFKKDNQPY